MRPEREEERMGNIVKTAKCRFCGQMTQIEADEELTAAQAETIPASMALAQRFWQQTVLLM